MRTLTAFFCLWAGLAHATTVSDEVVVAVPPSAGPRSPALSYQPGAGAGNYVLVWEDSRGGGSDVALYGLRLSEAGVPIGSAVRLLRPPGMGNERQPALAASLLGPVPGHQLAFTVGNRVFTTRLSNALVSGAVRDLLGPGALSPQAFPRLVQDGSFAVYEGGGSVVGQRLDANGLPTGSATPLSVGTDPDVAGLAGRHVFSYVSAGAQVFAGSVPAAGGPGTAPRRAGTSTGSETRSRLAVLGQDVLAVWQRDQQGDRDIIGARLDPVTLLRRGGEIPIAVARRDQLGPAVAGHAGGALVVYQDRRRSSVNPEIFASQLGAQGQVLGEFPIFSFAGIAFEPAVVKGPASDYLVAAILDGSPSRLSFRIVRDEPPAGMMTAAAQTALADGVATAPLRFGPARGASGFQAVDGTQYDVTVTGPGVQVATPDADPARPGVQVASAQGQVFVEVRSTTAGPATVTVASVEGTAVGSATATFVNVPPVARDVRIEPATPTSLVPLQLRYAFFDVNGDPEGPSEIRWTRNQVQLPAFDGARTIPASATQRGEVWRASVRPSDGQGFGALAFSSPVTIGNAPPEATGVRIEREGDPTQPVRGGDPIRLVYIYSDPDRDAEGPTRIRWTDQGQPLPALDDSQRVPGAEVRRGRVFVAEVTPSDGLSFGAPVSSAPLSVLNSPPVAVVVETVEVMERARVVLDGTGSFDPDGDGLGFAWTQAGGPAVPLTGAASATPSFDAPSIRSGSTFLSFDLVVSDGDASSSPARVAVVVLAYPDTDRDGLDDEEESRLGTNPNNPDTDDDGLLDGEEVENGANPLDADSDDDGLIDGEEGRACPTCDPAPFSDIDADGLAAVLDPDSDGDGLFDGLELGITEPVPARTIDGFASAGTDVSVGSFTPDADPTTTTNPANPDTDGDGLLDGQEDQNRNGRVDPGETDPNDPNDPCRTDEQCPRGLVCIDGGCVPAPERMCEPLPEGQVCCQGGCQGGAPIVEARCGDGQTMASCPRGSQQCAESVCLAPPPECRFASDCGAGQLCREGQCVTPAGSGTCAPLDPAFECCRTACSSVGELAQAACAAGETEASCPADAELCSAGACSGRPGVGVGVDIGGDRSSGSSCAQVGNAGLFSLLGLLALVRRRR